MLVSCVININYMEVKILGQGRTLINSSKQVKDYQQTCPWILVNRYYRTQKFNLFTYFEINSDHSNLWTCYITFFRKRWFIIFYDNSVFRLLSGTLLRIYISLWNCGIAKNIEKSSQNFINLSTKPRMYTIYLYHTYI